MHVWLRYTGWLDKGEKHMTLFLQGIAFGIAFYMMIDFIDWFDEDQA